VPPDPFPKPTGRDPVAVGRAPLAVGGGLLAVIPYPSRWKLNRGRCTVAGASYPVPVAFDPLAAGRDPSAGNIAQGPPHIGSVGLAAGSKTTRRRPPARGWWAEARAMFLANIYALF